MCALWIMNFWLNNPILVPKVQMLSEFSDNYWLGIKLWKFQHMFCMMFVNFLGSFISFGDVLHELWIFPISLVNVRQRSFPISLLWISELKIMCLNIYIFFSRSVYTQKSLVLTAKIWCIWLTDYFLIHFHISQGIQRSKNTDLWYDHSFCSDDKILMAISRLIVFLSKWITKKG